MEPTESEKQDFRPLRRSTRQTSVKTVGFEPTPRGPLKRARRVSESKTPTRGVNGTKDVEDDSDDEDSPSKKSRMAQRGPEEGGRGDDTEMDSQESDEDQHEEQEMDTEQDNSSRPTHLPKHVQGSQRGLSLSPRVVLGERCQMSRTVNVDPDLMKPQTVKQATKAPVSPIKSAVQTGSITNRHNAPAPKLPSKAEYHKKMENIARSVELPTVNRRVRGTYPYLPSEKFVTLPSHVNNIPAQKRPAHHKKTGEIKKTIVDKKSPESSPRGFMWCFWGLLLMLVLGCAALLPHEILPALQSKVGVGRPQSRAVKPEEFADHFSLLVTRFPSQRSEVWDRSKIHLEKHLRTEEPTEPVSLIFTAGRGAERTLHCLAQGLASSFSSALNASVLHIDGTRMSSQDSDVVKLDIDNQLKAAFEGEKPVAVIHRFEELPPGSTLIFYRYCDHESAAYKRVFLLFTVLLPQEEVASDQSLKEVEELVQDYVHDRLVGSNSPSAFDKMDTDKLGGLWSRISHLVLPVVSEQEVEQNGC